MANAAIRVAALLAAVSLCMFAAWGAVAGETDDMPLPVPRLTIYPGDTIEADKLDDRMFVARTVTRGAVFEAREPVVGKVASKTLLPGRPIPVNAVREPYAVTQGKTAMLIYRTDGLTITSSAMALQNGSIGDLVSARNLDSGLVVRGTVQPDGSVRVD
jgi:flagella basal body P-ring formation protein FlgA